MLSIYIKRFYFFWATEVCVCVCVRPRKRTTSSAV